MFELMFGLFFIVWILAFGTIVVRGITQWNKNNHSPRLTVPATLVTRRYSVHHHHNNGHTHRSTTYFVTFQFESGDRMEFSVKGTEYGLMAEGDRGNLTFQGTRFLSFERV